MTFLTEDRIIKLAIFTVITSCILNPLITAGLAYLTMSAALATQINKMVRNPAINWIVFFIVLTFINNIVLW